MTTHDPILAKYFERLGMKHYSGLATISPQRTLEHVLADLGHARRDWEDAISDRDDDRAAEAEQRLDSLREDFDRRLLMLTGITVEQIRTAFERALI